MEEFQLGNHTYKLLELLGHGGTGRVYVGENEKGDQVAVKLIFKEGLAELSLKDIIRENELMISSFNKCRKYIPKFIDFSADLDEDFYVIVMEYIEGISLREFIWNASEGKYVSQTPRQLSRAIIYLLRLLTDGVTCLNKNKIVHRDLKPENVMVQLNTLELKIVDFGLGCMNNKIYGTYTCKSEYRGTANYVAPEVWREKIEKGQFDKVDVFSLGCIFFEAATGNLLFPGSYVKGTILGGDHSRIDTGNKALDFIIERMIEPNPKYRPTAKHILDYFPIIEEDTEDGHFLKIST